MVLGVGAIFKAGHYNKLGGNTICVDPIETDERNCQWHRIESFKQGASVCD
jgi:hypothetical protein